MNKPEITATIKFRGVTVEGMTVAELRELRDLLNTLVGEPKVERIIERHVSRPWTYWTYSADNSLRQASYATDEWSISLAT
jgi:hypothetical protein